MSSDWAELSYSDLLGQPGKEQGGGRQGTKTLPTHSLTCMGQEREWGQEGCATMHVGAV